jgi:hypothetical protein
LASFFFIVKSKFHPKKAEKAEKAKKINIYLTPLGFEPTMIDVAYSA